jgi:hypothetical protein
MARPVIKAIFLDKIVMSDPAVFPSINLPGAMRTRRGIAAPYIKATNPVTRQEKTPLFPRFSLFLQTRFESA